jgi:hypothetical protein
MMPVVKTSQFLFARLQVKTIRDSSQQREKERAKNWEKKVRGCVLLKVIVTSLVNLTVGQISRSSAMGKLLDTNKMAIMKG